MKWTNFAVTLYVGTVVLIVTLLETFPGGKDRARRKVDR